VTILRRSFLALALTVILVYTADYLIARSRGARVLGTVQVLPYYAVPLKDGKTEFMMLDPENRTCVHSLAPHFGYPPCWYLNGRKEQRINM
jgi:hypothetical protein